MGDHLLILHLSDLHFGPHNRFSNIDSMSLAKRFNIAIEEAKKDLSIKSKIDLVIITGDLVELGLPKEYRQATDFLSSLSKELEVEHKHFIFIPGNHDICWLDSEKAELEQRKDDFNDEELNRRINEYKFYVFKDFLNDFYGLPQEALGQKLERDAFIYNFNNIKLSVAALNSCELESHRKKDHRGVLSAEQAQSVMNYWQTNIYQEWIKIIAIHHNPVAVGHEDRKNWIAYLEEQQKQNSLNAEQILRYESDVLGLEGSNYLQILAKECQVQLVLHGHQHITKEYSWPRKNGNGYIDILSAGSFGLDTNKLPRDQKNSLRLIFLDIKNENLISTVRVYDPTAQANGIIEPGHFVSDYSGIYKQKLLSSSKVKVENETKIPKYVSKETVKKATYERTHFGSYYEFKDKFTGRIKERKILTEWLSASDRPILILTAIGGMGKSSLAWAWLHHDVLNRPLPGVLPDKPEEIEACHVSDGALPEGVFWWSFYEQEAGFEKFLDEALLYTNNNSIDLNELSTHDKISKLLYTLKNNYYLLILDGFERELHAYSTLNAAYQEGTTVYDEKGYRRCTNLSADKFLRWLSGSPLKSRILLTTRHIPLELDESSECKILPLSGLNPVDAVRFFQSSGIKGTKIDIKKVCEYYEYHPLTLRVLAGMIAHDLDNPMDIKSAPSCDPIPKLEQREHHILELAYSALHPLQRELLSRLSAFRSLIDIEAVKTLNPYENEIELKATLYELEERNLIILNRERKRYELHPIIREYAYKLLKNKEVIHERLRDYFNKSLSNYFAIPHKPESIDELNPIIELYHHTTGAGKFDEAFALYKKRLSDYLFFKFYVYPVNIKLLKSLFPNNDDNSLPLISRIQQGDVLNEIALNYEFSGQSVKATSMIERALLIAEELNQTKNIIIALYNIAGNHLLLGNIQSATEGCVNAIRLLDDLINKIDKTSNSASYQELLSIKVLIHTELAKILAYNGSSVESGQELAIADKTEVYRCSIFGCADTLQQGNIYFSRALRALTLNKITLREIKSAFAASQKAVKIAKINGYLCFIIEAKMIAGMAQIRLATMEEESQTKLMLGAERDLKDALDLCRQINLVKYEPLILLSWAKLYNLKGNTSRSKDYAEEALYIADRCNYRLYEAEIRNFLSCLSLDEGDQQNAVTHAKIAYDYAKCNDMNHCYKLALQEAEAILNEYGE